MRFVPIEEAEKQQGLTFVPIENTAVPPQTTASVTPAAAATSGLDGGVASKTVLDGPEMRPYEPSLVERAAEFFGLGGNKAKSANELAARRIASERGTSVDQVYRDAGGSRPMFNPEGRPITQAVPEAAAVVANDLPRVPAAAANTALRAIRGGDMGVTDQGILDRAITATSAPKKKVDPNYEGLSGFGESLGYSLTTMVTSALTGAAATTATANPAVGVGAGMAASGTVSYRASKDEFVGRVRDNLNTQAKKLYGRELNDQEWSQALKDFDSAAVKYGAWEAIPEAISNALFLKAFSAPARAAKGARLTELTQKAGSLASEQATETITALGQNKAEMQAGLSNEEMNVVDAFRKQFLQTMLISGGMAGGAKSIDMAKDFYKSKVEPLVAPGTALARAIESDLNQVALNHESTRKAAVNALNPDNAQLRFVPVAEADNAAPPAAPTQNVQSPEPPVDQPAANVQMPSSVSIYMGMTDAMNGNLKDGDVKELLAANGMLDDEGKLNQKGYALANQFNPQGVGAQPLTTEQADELVRNSFTAAAKPKETVAPTQQQAAPVAAPDTQRVSTVTGRQVETRMRVIDASELKPASGDLQPRDRSRAASDEQINNIASQLDPQRLGHSAEADRGAPIIGPDMIVESGNGRVQSIRRAFAMFPERAQAYRDYLKSLGYDTTGINEPVLVRERVTPMTQQERVAFVQESNQAATMDLTPVERAKIDVSALKDSVVDVWAGGDITSAANRDFVRAFIGQLPQAQRNGMLDDNGMLSPDGATRIRRALLAAAYDDRDLLAKLIDSADDNIKSIGNALFDAAPAWLQMRRLAREGIIPAHYDVTQELVLAARTVDQLRQTKARVQEWLAQNDLTSERNPIVDEFVRAFYNEDLSRAVGRDAINDVLKTYVDYAKRQDTEDLLGGEPPKPEELTRSAVEQRNERNRKPDNGTLFDAEASSQPSSDGGSEQGVQQGGSTAVAPFVRRVGKTLGGRSAEGSLLRDSADRDARRMKQSKEAAIKPNKVM